MSKSFGRNRVLDRVDLDLRRGPVMGLMGENGAKKSMMMRYFLGAYREDEDETVLDDHEVSFSESKDALENGITMARRELNQRLERSIMDNLFLGRYPVDGAGIVGEAHTEKEAAELFRNLGITMNLTQPMRNVSVPQRQVCKITKAIPCRSKIIVLDGPTPPPTKPEVGKLFTMMRRLQDQGIPFIYISHKMDEVFEIYGRVSVLQDGKLVMTEDTSGTNLDEPITAIVGHSLENRFPPVDNTSGNDIFSIQHLSIKFEPRIQGTTFNAREGEIFGPYGLVSIGRAEFLETILGIRTRAAGRIYYDGESMNFSSAKETMEHGFMSITEERKANGLFLKGNLTPNTIVANLKHYKNGPALLGQGMVKAASKQLTTMHTKYMGSEGLTSNLSGSNQQKVIFGKWLEREPNVFMMDEPTRDTDVDAKCEIYELIIRMAEGGRTIIVVSSEVSEILGTTSRIGVMSNGYLSGITETKETNQEGLLRLSAKYL